MKKITVWLSIVLCFLALAGCSRTEAGESSGRADGVSEENGATGGAETQEATQPPDPPRLTGEYVPVAEFAEAPFLVFEFGYQYIYRDEEIICQGGEDDDRILAYACDGTNTPRVLAEADCGEMSHIRAFFIDGEGSLYLYENVFLSPDESSCYLRKIDKEGREAYRVNFAEEDIFSCVIYVDQNGNAVLIDQMEWEIYFFDSEGSYLGRESVPYEDGGRRISTPIHTGKNDLICIEGQYFLWSVKEEDGFISLWEVDFENCHISEEKIIDMTSFGDAEYKAAHAGRGSRFDGLLFDGGPLGLLISTEDVLWQYDMDTGLSTVLLRWDERLISIDGRCVWQIDTGETGEGGTALEVMVYNDIQQSYTYATPEIATITYIDKAYIKESQAVSIGLSSTAGGIEQTIRRFNRLNNGYEAVLVDYDADMLKDMLSYGKEIPDLLDVTTIRTEWLENKDLLEDLTPYFETSSTIGIEDILPAVWELLEGDDGKLACMATGFRIRALTTASDLPEDGWTYSRLLSLENEYPGSLYMDQHTPLWVWDLISTTAVDDFIDWDARRCSFDSPEFCSLIEGVKNLDYPERRRPGNSADILERMADGQILMRYSSYGAPYDYEREQAESGGALRTISFPTADGEPTYLFAAGQSLAIYGESPNKDGAWAFLEFLLTEAEQSWFGTNRQMFPVNADAFNEYLSRPYSPRGRTYIIVPEGGSQNLSDLIAAQTLVENPASEETRDKIRDMVSHLALNQNTADEISSIIKEELQAYFAGDKTVAQTTATIQNRVQLYLDEM